MRGCRRRVGASSGRCLQPCSTTWAGGMATYGCPMAEASPSWPGFRLQSLGLSNRAGEAWGQRGHRGEERFPGEQHCGLPGATVERHHPCGTGDGMQHHLTGPAAELEANPSSLRSRQASLAPGGNGTSFFGLLHIPRLWAPMEMPGCTFIGRGVVS